MDYKEHCNTLDIFGRINVIAVHPAFNVRAAVHQLRYDECFKAYDLDLKTFMMRNAGVTEENYCQLYIQHIKTAISNCYMKQQLEGPDMHTTYILFVSDRQEIRQAICEAEIPFLWIFPTECPNDTTHWHKALEKWTRNNQWMADKGLKWAVASKDQLAELDYRSTQTYGPEVLHARQYELAIDWSQTPDLTDVVYWITKIPLGYGIDHTLRKESARELNNRMRYKIMQKMAGRTYGWCEKNVTAGISSQGYRYLILSGKRTSKPLVEFAEQRGMPSRVADKLANQGSDFVVLRRDDAVAIVDMLNDAIRRLESGTRDDNDVEVFGDKAISYERLIDELDHTVLLRPTITSEKSDKE